MSKTKGTCDDCGLCCQHLLVQADAVDVLREPRIEVSRPLGKRSAQLSVLDACWILAYPGSPCTFLTNKKACSIYATRPQNCVAFIPGAPKCQELRRDHGMAPVILQPSVHRILNEIVQEVITAETKELDLQ